MTRKPKPHDPSSNVAVISKRLAADLDAAGYDAPGPSARSIAVATVAAQRADATSAQAVAEIVASHPTDIGHDARWAAAHRDAREIARLEVEIMRRRRHVELLVGRMPPAVGLPF